MFPKSLYQYALLATCISPSFATLFTDPSQLTKSTYDYVIVGAGTAGNVVAARLTEDSRISVLVVEAGISDAEVFPIQIPLIAPSLTPNTPYDWNYTTTAQSGFNGRSVNYPRGKMLGGSSSVNYCVFMRGSSEDFDRYAIMTGDSGWNWANMQQYMRKNEKWVAPADGHNTAGQFTPALHSTTGAVSVSLPGFATPLDERIIATTKELSAEFPFNQDMGGGSVLGIGWTQSSVGNGQRSSSSTAYLTPAMSRPNLDVLVNAQATKLIQTGTIAGLPAFHVVQLSGTAPASVKNITARVEIVLSAGSFGTPLLLQQSGIGDTADLSPLGINTIVRNPSVGKNMSDHTLLVNTFEVNTTGSFDTIFANGDLLNQYIGEWQTSKTGPLVDSLSNHLGWLRLPASASIFQTTPDPAAGPKSSHYEILFSNAWAQPGSSAPAGRTFMSISTVLISPTSRGNIKPSSNNAFIKPLINPNFLNTKFDIFTMVESVKAAKRFAAANAWKDFVIGPYGDLATATTDAQIEAYVRSNSATIFHATGTASMSPKGAKWGVVDPDLKVKGVEGIRVVDVSILPFSPNAHTQGPAYLVGERGADLIKKDWKA